MTLAELPDVLVIAEVAAVMRVSTKAIYNALYAGTFLPLPCSERPHRWRKADVEAWLRGEYVEPVKALKRQRRRRLRSAVSA